MALVDKHFVRLVKVKRTYDYESDTLRSVFIQSCVLDPNSKMSDKDYEKRKEEDYKIERIIDQSDPKMSTLEYTYPTDQPFIKIDRTGALCPSTDGNTIHCPRSISVACKRTRCFLFEANAQHSIVYQLKDDGQMVRLYELKDDEINFTFVFADLGLMVTYNRLPDKTYDVIVTRIVDRSLVFQCRVKDFRRVKNWLLTRQVNVNTNIITSNSSSSSNNSQLIAYEFKLVNKEYKIKEYNLSQCFGDILPPNLDIQDYSNRYFGLGYWLKDCDNHPLIDKHGIYQCDVESGEYAPFVEFDYTAEKSKHVKKLYRLKIFDTVQQKFASEYMFCGIDGVDLDVQIKTRDGVWDDPNDDITFLCKGFPIDEVYRINSDGQLVNVRSIKFLNTGGSMGSNRYVSNANVDNQISFIPSEETRDVIKNIIAEYTHCFDIVMDYLF